VPDLAGGTEGSVVRPPVQDQATADPGPQAARDEFNARTPRGFPVAKTLEEYNLGLSSVSQDLARRSIAARPDNPVAQIIDSLLRAEASSCQAHRRRHARPPAAPRHRHRHRGRQLPVCAAKASEREGRAEHDRGFPPAD